MTSTSNALHWTSSCECVSFQLVRCPTPRVPWRSPRCVRRVRLGRSCWSGRTASSWTTAPTGRSSCGKVHIQYIVRMLLYRYIDKGRRTHCSPCRASIRKRSKCWGEAVGPEDGRQIHRSDELSQDENSGLSPFRALRSFVNTSLMLLWPAGTDCAAGGDPAAGKGDHHLQAVLQKLELNISTEELVACAYINMQRSTLFFNMHFICIYL